MNGVFAGASPDGRAVSDDAEHDADRSGKHASAAFTLICTFYIGSIIAEPARETLSASLADARARGSYMGFSRLGLAFGGALGYAGGGWLFDAGKALNQPELPG